MYTVMRKGYGGLDDDMCIGGDYEYMKTEKEANNLKKKLESEFGEKCSDIHPWKGSTFYVQEVTDEYIKMVTSKEMYA